MVAKVNSMSDRQLSDLTLIGIGIVASSKEGRGLAIKAAINRRIAGIECNHALILPHRANPAGSDFRERQVIHTSSARSLPRSRTRAGRRLTAMLS